MIVSRAVASILGVAVVALVPACGTRSVAWSTALADTGCHASDTIVRKLKTEPDTFAVSACGEVITYRCDAATSTCVADRTPSSAPVTSPGTSDTPLVPQLEGPAPRRDASPEEAAPEAAQPEEAQPEAAPSGDAPASDAAPGESDASEGEVPEPPAARS